MKRKTFFISFILIFSAIGLQTIPAQVVKIPDANLRAVIEEELGHAAGEIITVEEMRTLTYLVARGRNISDLTGLAGMRNLEGLDLSNNAISDIFYQLQAGDYSATRKMVILK